MPEKKKRKKGRKTPVKTSAKVNKGGVAAALVLTYAVLGGACFALVRQDGQEIPQTEIIPRVVDAPDPVLDIELVKRSFAYTDIPYKDIDYSLLVTDGGEAPAAHLQPVYNAVFSDEGLQIVSLADTAMKCRAEAVRPLSQMMRAFYKDTELRTMMINAAFEPAAEPEYEYSYDEYGEPVSKVKSDSGSCGEHEDGYSFDLGIYDEESVARRPFSFVGPYSWFAEHSWEFGFICRYTAGKEEITGKAAYEPHFRYVGKLAAQIMHDNSLCFEEFEEFMKEHTLDDPIVFGSDTVIYSQPAEGETAVPASDSGEMVPFEAFYLGEGDTLLIAAVPTKDLYSVPPPESDHIIYRTDSSNG